MSTLRELRGNITQARVAEQSGVSQSMYSYLESGRLFLKKDTAKMLKKALGKEVMDLVHIPADHIEGYMSTKDAGKRMRPRMDQDDVRRLCSSGRIPGSRKVLIEGRQRWQVPIGFKVEGGSRWGNLSERKKNAIARDYISGLKTGRQLAAIHKIDPSYPSQLVKRGYPKLIT